MSQVAFNPPKPTHRNHSTSEHSRMVNALPHYIGKPDSKGVKYHKLYEAEKGTKEWYQTELYKLQIELRTSKWQTWRSGFSIGLLIGTVFLATAWMIWESAIKMNPAYVGASEIMDGMAARAWIIGALMYGVGCGWYTGTKFGWLPKWMGGERK